LGGGQNRGTGGAILTPQRTRSYFSGFLRRANFGENRSRNATVRVLADGQTHIVDRQTDANRFYNLSHAICYSYGTDKNHSAQILHYTVSMSRKTLGTAASSIVSPLMKLIVRANNQVPSLCSNNGKDGGLGFKIQIISHDKPPLWLRLCRVLKLLEY